MTTHYSDPVSNGPTVDWDYDDYTNVDDGVRQPTVPTTSPATTETVYHSDDNPSESATWDFSVAASAHEVTEVTLWVYRNYEGDNNATWTVDFGGALGAADSSGWSGNWYYQTWTGLEIDLVSGLSPRVTGTFPAIAKGDDSSAYAALYLEYERESSGPAYHNGGSGPNSAFLLFV